MVMVMVMMGDVGSDGGCDDDGDGDSDCDGELLRPAVATGPCLPVLYGSCYC
jgi:hypothetical protein